jgi:hypothetical protein
MTMPSVLTLEFELKAHTDENGEPKHDPVEYVPVLVRAKHPPGQDPSGKAFCGPEGWRNPEQSDKPLYKIGFNPNSSQHWGDLWKKLRNDILERDDCPDPVQAKTGGKQ